MSSAPSPSILPGTAQGKPTAAPELLRPVPVKPRHRRRWLLIALVIVAVAGGVWIVRQQTGAAKPEMAVLRTATIAAGDLDRTIRVSGIVTAEKFAALMAPRLRGSRNASGGFGAGGTKSVGTGSSATSSTSSTASSTSSAASSSSSSSSTATGSGQNSSTASTNTALNAQSATAGTPGAPRRALVQSGEPRTGSPTARLHRPTRTNPRHPEAANPLAPRWERTDWDRLQPGC